MNSTPRLSVIVPVYKVEAYLRECLDSIKKQTFTDFEVLMIDDGSPDSSGTICEEYAAKDSRFKAFHKENEGQGIARNYGQERASGEWIHFFDSDDYLMSESVYQEIFDDLGNDEYDMIHFGYKFGKSEIYPFDKLNKRSLDRQDVINVFYKFSNVWSYFVKREKLINYKAEKLKTGQDTLFSHILLLTRIQSILLINKIFIYYRVHENSTTQTFQKSRMDDLLYTVNSVKKVINDDKIKIDYKAYNEFVVEFFFFGLYNLAKFKDADYIAKVIKEYTHKFRISKVLTWSYVLDRSKPILPYLFLKLGLFKQLANEVFKKEENWFY